MLRLAARAFRRGTLWKITSKCLTGFGYREQIFSNRQRIHQLRMGDEEVGYDGDDGEEHKEDEEDGDEPDDDDGWRAFWYLITYWTYSTLLLPLGLAAHRINQSTPRQCTVRV